MSFFTEVSGSAGKRVANLVHRRKVVTMVLATAMLVSVGLVRIDSASAITDPWGDDTFVYSGCDVARSNSWGYGCVGVTFSRMSGVTTLADVTYSVADRMTDGHYVEVQRNLSWIGDGWKTMQTSGTTRGNFDSSRYSSWSGRYIDVRIHRTGTGDYLTVGRVYLRD